MSANAIPRNAAVLADVDDIDANVGFWAPQADFRIPERLSPGFATFPDIELVMIYIEQPDGSGHQFLLTDQRQASVPNFYGAHGYDPAIPEMSAIFFAAGPDIRAGRLTRARNIDIAPTVARLLDVELGPTVDGAALPVRIGRKVTQDLIDRLTALLPTGDVQDDREIEKAIGRLQESLSDRYWDSDTQLGSKGKQVFDAHEAAVRILSRVGGQAAALRKAIVTVSEELAAGAVDAALGVASDERRLTRAQEALAKAREATADGRLDDAINHYLRAWDDARRVLGSAS